MNTIYVCKKELDYGIEDEIIHVGDMYEFVTSYGDRTIIKGVKNSRVLEIYDWALKEYFKEVV